MNVLESFHFLRPWWLVALLPAAAVLLATLRRADAQRAWQRWVDPALLEALLVRGEERRRFRPAHLLCLFWLVGLVALAGPSWRREPSPFAEDRAALVIALKVTPSMLTEDIAPSRLERAAHKITDLLGRRAGARNALVAYAGSAHLVMPLTKDPNAITTFVNDLAPELMPQEGDDPVAALRLATGQLSKSGSPGAVLFFADDWDESGIAAVEEHGKQGGVPVHVLATLADERLAPENAPAVSTLRRVAAAGGGTFSLITPDSTDVVRLAGQIQQTARATAAETGDRWRDEGYWMLPLLVAMAGMWFRKGWVLGGE
jgi:Ca-activated chloride channel family protein